MIEKDIAAIEATYSANVALAGTATANVTDFDSSLGFVGLNISLPVKDGGKRNYQIQEKKMQIEALNQQKNDLSLLHMTSFKALQNFQKIYKLRSKLLLDQIENSKVISEDIELKLRAGAASVIDLATEKMNFYDFRWRQPIRHMFVMHSPKMSFFFVLFWSFTVSNVTKVTKSQ